MEKKEKQLIIIIIAIAVSIAIIYMIAKSINKSSENKKEQNVIIEQYVQNLTDGTKINTSAKLNEEKSFQGLKISNIQFTNRNGKTELIADVENNTTEDTEAMLVDVILYDKEGKQIATMSGRISPIKKGEKKQFSTVSVLDHTDAYNFELKLKQ